MTTADQPFPQAVPAPIPAGVPAVTPPPAPPARPIHKRTGIYLLLIYLLLALCLTPITFRIWRSLIANTDLISMKREQVVTDEATLSPVAFFTRLSHQGNIPVLTIKRDDYVRTLPENINALTGLEILFIAHNPLRSIPGSVGDLSNLRHVLIQNTYLNTLPPGVGNASSLEILSLQGNRIRQLPNVFSSLGRLETLNLAYNSLSELPPSIADLTSLTLLDLTGNRFTSFPKHLPPNLGTLFIGGNKIPLKELEEAQLRNAFSDLIIYY